MKHFEEANRIIKAFFMITDDKEKSLVCALHAVDEILDILRKNRGFTQCVIDAQFYELVKEEILNQIKK